MMREFGVIAFAIDPLTLQGWGAFFGGLAAFGTLVAGLLNRTRLKSFFEDRFLLIESANEYRKRWEASEQMAGEFKKAVEAMGVTIDQFERRLAHLEKIEKKFDTLCLWVVKIVEFVASLERRARDAGADLDGLTMPAIPPDLKDDIETAKGAR